MGYVVYNAETTRKLTDRTFRSEAAAKAARTRAAKAGEIDATDYAVAESGDFHDNIEKFVTRTNLLSGKEYQERVNTPIYCSPASESYWSM